MNNWKSAFIFLILLTFIGCEKDEIQDYSTIFMGDSITEQWKTIDSKFFNQNNYTSVGISGNTTEQMLNRFENDVLNRRPIVVVINGSINDMNLSYDKEKTFDNIKRMTEMSLNNNIQVILTSVLPASSIPWRPNIENVSKKITDLNSMIKSYAIKIDVSYIDYHSQMVNSAGGLIAEYTTDGVHVSAPGYKIMESLIKEEIEKLIKLAPVKE